MIYFRKNDELFHEKFDIISQTAISKSELF